MSGPAVKICPVCGAPGTARCSRCTFVWYCGRKCQVADWKRHKKDCRPPDDAAPGLVAATGGCHNSDSDNNSEEDRAAADDVAFVRQLAARLASRDRAVVMEACRYLMAQLYRDNKYGNRFLATLSTTRAWEQLVDIWVNSTDIDVLCMVGGVLGKCPETSTRLEECVSRGLVSTTVRHMRCRVSKLAFVTPALLQILLPVIGTNEQAVLVARTAVAEGATVALLRLFMGDTVDGSEEVAERFGYMRQFTTVSTLHALLAYEGDEVHKVVECGGYAALLKYLMECVRRRGGVPDAGLPSVAAVLSLVVPQYPDLPAGFAKLAVVKTVLRHLRTPVTSASSHDELNLITHCASLLRALLQDDEVLCRSVVDAGGIELGVDFLRNVDFFSARYMWWLLLTTLFDVLPDSKEIAVREGVLLALPSLFSRPVPLPLLRAWPAQISAYFLTVSPEITAELAAQLRGTSYMSGLVDMIVDPECVCVPSAIMRLDEFTSAHAVFVEDFCGVGGVRAVATLLATRVRGCSDDKHCELMALLARGLAAHPELTGQVAESAGSAVTALCDAEDLEVSAAARELATLLDAERAR